MKRNKKITSLKALLEKVIEKESKYFDLVWFVRGNEDTRKDIPLAMEAHNRIMNEFPKEVERLLEDEENWEHGFNSGCLATLRYILSLTEDIEQAEEEFPFLDT